MALAKFNSTAGGSYFKPADYGVGTTFVIDVLHYARQVPGDFGPKDTATVDLHVFNGGSDVTVLEGTKINQTYLAADLEAYAGQTIAVTLEQTDPKPGKKPAWVWRPVTDSALMAEIEKYVESKDEVDGPPGL